MLHRTHFLRFAACAVTGWLMTLSTGPVAEAQRHPVWRNNDVMYNYYAGPAEQAGGTAAQLYLSPRPTPPLVGHTYITYQPLMPHEFLYKHHRTYSAVHPEGGWVRTNVSYGTFPLFSKLKSIRYRPKPAQYHTEGPHRFFLWEALSP